MNVALKLRPSCTHRIIFFLSQRHNLDKKKTPRWPQTERTVNMRALRTDSKDMRKEKESEVFSITQTTTLLMELLILHWN